MTAEVLVKLAARDPWSFTVLDALRCKLGVGAVAGVERLKSWRLDFHVDSEEEVLATTRKILEETALLANPNRDIWMVRCRAGFEVPETLIDAPLGSGRSFAVRVTDRDDLVGRSIGTILRRRLGLAKITAVAYSLVWIVWFARPGDDLLGLVEDVAVARSWRRGLLANPHSQDAVVRRLEDYLCGGVGL